MTRDVSSADRRTVLQGLAATGALALVGNVTAKDEGPETSGHRGGGGGGGDSGLTPVYRLYKPSVQDHFYTTSESEKNNAVQNLGYRDEGIEWYSPDRQVAGTTPLYRLYKGGENANHFYTTNADERDNAANNLGYRKEGTEGYLFTSPSPALVPVYRLYRGRDDDHFYTTSKAERDNAATNLGYRKEGIVGYGVTDPDASPIASPLSIETDNADVTVTATNRSDVLVDSGSSRQRFSVRELDGTLRLDSTESSYQIEVPETLPVERVVTAAGDVSVTATTGDLAVETSTGDLTARRIEGTVTAQSDAGDVTIRRPNALGDVTSSTGSVDVDVPALPGDATVTTQTGDIEAQLDRELDAELTASTQAGDVVISGLPLRNVDRGGGIVGETVTGTLGGGGPRLTLEASTGDVTVGPL